jgi:hypothetical protein
MSKKKCIYCLNLIRKQNKCEKNHYQNNFDGTITDFVNNVVNNSYENTYYDKEKK